VQEDVVLVLADAAPFPDLHRHRAANDVARGKILGGGRVALHEALALGIDEIAAFAARPLSDQAACAIDAGWVELHELHILQRQADAQRHRVAVPGASVSRSGREISAAIAASGEHSGLSAEPMDRTVIQLEADDAAHCALGVPDEIDGEIFDEELALRPQRLTVERVQDGVAGAVGGGAGALCDALAIVGRHAAEWALVDLAFFGARERHAPMVEFVHGGGRIAAQVFNRVLVAEPVGALNGVVHMPSPIVRPHIAERRRNAALRRDGVRTRGKHFRNACRAQAGLGAADARSQARAARADHNNIECVVGDRISLASERRRALRGRAIGRHGCPSS
jgi:hypothetical protein